ncbi:hypothetical protein QFZ40_004404 [Arthrobacter pascens]|nr:hypothetical protein [Arthrobacter pascens]
MRTQQTGENCEGRFAALYNDAYADVLRFVQRRAGPHRAELWWPAASLYSSKRDANATLSCDQTAVLG